MAATGGMDDRDLHWIKPPGKYHQPSYPISPLSDLPGACAYWRVRHYEYPLPSAHTLFQFVTNRLDMVSCDNNYSPLRRNWWTTPNVHTWSRTQFCRSRLWLLGSSRWTGCIRNEDKNVEYLETITSLLHIAHSSNHEMPAIWISYKILSTRWQLNCGHRRQRL